MEMLASGSVRINLRARAALPALWEISREMAQGREAQERISIG